jgi:hypothetical protein
MWVLNGTEGGACSYHWVMFQSTVRVMPHFFFIVFIIEL